LGPAGAPVRSFTVRLYLVEPEAAGKGERLLDVALQGRPVCTRLDIAGESGGGRRSLVKEARGIKASDLLELALAASPGAKAPRTVLCGLEIIEE
ncbi:MAG: malectin, partial [Armatimonadetes bacterium]|nr:malectin [Armatimonadota bacterium]